MQIKNLARKLRSLVSLCCLCLLAVRGWHVMAADEEGGGDRSTSKSIRAALVKLEITTPTTTAMNIDATPAMPSPTFHAELTPAELRPNTTFKWYLEIRFTLHGRNDLHRIPASGTTDIQGNGDWQPAFGDVLAGGDVKVYCTATIQNMGDLPKDKSGYQIKGTNPGGATTRSGATINQQVVMYKESLPKWCQFSSSPGWPIFGPPNGWGLMQLDPPPSEAVIWNWQSNRTAGCNVLAGKYAGGLGYPGRQRASHGGNPHIRDWNSDQERWTEGYQLYNGGNAYTFVFDDPAHPNTSDGHWANNPGCSGYGVDAWNIQTNVEAGSPPAGW